MTPLSSEAERVADELTKWARNYAGTTYEDDMATKAAALLRRIPELEAEVKKLEMLNSMAATCIQMTAVERDKLLASEHGLSASYVRIREAIGAMHPPSLETDALWSYVEQTARDLVAERDQLRAELEKSKRALTICRDTLPHIGGNPSSVQSLMSIINAATPTPPHADQKGQ